MKILINTAFNLNMVEKIDEVILTETCLSVIPKEKFLELLETEKPENYLGHPGLLPILKTELGKDFEVSRGTLKLPKGVHQFLVVQYIGRRLMEGETTLPENAKIIYVLETVEIS